MNINIPVAIAIGLFVQTAGVVWWASNIDNRVAHLEARVVNEGRVIRLEVQMAGIKEALLRIENMVATLAAGIEPASGSEEPS
ncbi:MAG: hypothetical protein OXQ92_03690 [Boseongicola sp.]|nr:hypothetical protein [Boseongicola sp.]